MVNAQNRKRSNSSGPGSAKKPKFGGRPGSNGPPSAGKFGGRPGSNGRPSAGKFGKRSGSNGPPSAGKFDKRSNSNGSAFGKKPKFGQHEDSSPAFSKQEKTRFPVGKVRISILKLNCFNQHIYCRVRRSPRLQARLNHSQRNRRPQWKRVMALILMTNRRSRR
jgi:hypothetical protein